ELPVVTNPKVAAINPTQWARFRGVSLLLNNSNAGLASDGIVFYDHLDTFADRHQAELESFQWCRLPRSTYHVTLLDGINDSNIEEVTSHRDALRRFLDALPDSLSIDSFVGRQSAPLLDFITDHPMLRGRFRSVRLSFDALDIWGNSVL